MQNRGAPDAACGRPSTGAASTTSTSARKHHGHGARRQSEREDQGCGDQPGRPGLRKIASSFDKVRRAFTFRSDNGGTSSSSSSSRPGSPYPLSGGGAAADVDEPVKGSRVGEQQGESEHAGAVELTQANPRFSYDSDHAPPARR
ncbi:hypothetical protein MCOR02_004467 [Pyricularia oryzae]|nr:hypothetical protein MCOR02_004467 [Pyricularia oryzae]